MSSPDHQNDAGEQWRDDLPSRWEECLPHPPVASGSDEQVDVVEQAGATFFWHPNSATRWISADAGDVLDREDCR
jgi:hypothetical protein